jgi:surface antigen
MKYTPRLKAPETTNKNYRHIDYRGYNQCLYIGNGLCLPNCVGYAWGRWRELLGENPKLSRSNAENWFSHKDGYERGQTPKLGAVICWRKGKSGNASDGAGHVAIVEQINADGSIVISNSGYKSTYFYLKTLKPPYKYKDGYTLQGFIYIPINYELATEVKKVKIELDVLKKGSKGAQVKTLQRLLSSFGHSLGKYGIDGSFGADTERAVKAFQK